MLCALCKINDDLRESHLIPRSVYRLCADIEHPHPVHVGRGRAFVSSHQLQRSLLCGECEQRFSDGGEKRVVAECFRGNGKFILQELLSAATPFTSEMRGPVFLGSQIPQLDVAQYLYFASSVFWRATAVRWKINRDVRRCVVLGRKYEEALRRYLLGDAAFPVNAALTILVAAEVEPPRSIVVPTGANQPGGFHVHEFGIPGVQFRLYVGSQIPSNIRELCCRETPEVLFLLWPIERQQLHQSALKEARRAKRVGSLARVGDGPD